MTPPTPEEVAEARRILQSMRARARWVAVSPEERKAHGRALADARWKGRLKCGPGGGA